MPGKMARFLSILALVAVLVSACAQPVPVAPSAEAPAAEAETAAAGAAAAAGETQEGGVWTRIIGSDASNLNPILYDDATSNEVIAMIYNGLIGQDPVTGEYNCVDVLCESWEVSDDGLTFTFTLRDDLKWSDGEAVDSADFKFTYDAINSDLVESPRTYVWEGLESIEAPDPSTIVVKYSEVRCDAVGNLGSGILPEHLYADDFSDIMESPDNEAPRLSAGPFSFQSWTRDDNVIVVRNDAYSDGAPTMDGQIYRVVPDAGARLAQLQSGEIDIVELQPSQLSAIEGNPAITRYSWNDDGYTYIGFNLGNPDNVLPGQDEEGNIIPQDPHPILGDKRVRQAIAYSLDYQSIIDDIFFGQGYLQPANVLPAVEWAYNPNIEPYMQDLEKAAALLEEAGWVDADGDGVREKDGMPLDLSLITNSSNTARMDLGAYVQDQLNSLGFNIDFQGLDFGTLLDQTDTQTYDMYILGWTGLGSDPNDDAFWLSNQDVPGSGFNNVSFYNERVEELLQTGVTVPGCAPEDRAPYYMEIQEIMHDELPYLWVRGTVANIGFNSNWANVDPQQWSIYWNVNQWALKSRSE